jgi:hypothetical protein
MGTGKHQLITEDINDLIFYILNKMPYAQAFTLIEELPPLMQVPAESQMSMSQMSGNKYYNEIIQEHPSVGRKIRNLESKPFGKLDETYQHLTNPPSVVRQNYLSESMIPQSEAQHLPVATNVPVHYVQPMVQSNTTYPIVEPFLTCRDAAEHVLNCPVCSRLYRTNEKLYLVGVGVLLLLIFMLVLWKR